MLKRLSEMVYKLRRYSGTEEKRCILMKYPDLKPLLKVIYDPDYIFNITGNRVESYMDNEYHSNSDCKYDNIFYLLNALNKKEITGNEALDEAVSFYIEYVYSEDESDVFFDILNKDLKCGISVKTINSVWPGLIKEFNVPLANEYEPRLCDFKKDKWFVSRKLDGIRCLCFIRPDGIEFRSRENHLFLTLDNLIPCIKEQYVGPTCVVLDGEVCIIDKDGNENFKDIVSEIRKKDYIIHHPRFLIFDVYYIADLDRGFKFKDVPFEFIDFRDGYVKMIEQIPVLDDEHFKHLKEELPDEWEGLILRKHPTLFKRSNNLLKVKRWKETEAMVESIIHSQKNINGESTNCIGALVFKYKGNNVSVGSGLSDNERVEWFNEPSKIIGKKITIKYFSESFDSDGKISLRHPIFKGVRDYE
jgi:DNA ligase-1